MSLWISLLVGASSLHAETAQKPQQEMRAGETALLEKVREKFQANFRAPKLMDFAPGPIDGLFEMVLGLHQMIYFHPDAELMFLGEVYTKEGVSLTRQRLKAIQKKSLAQIDPGDALIIGQGEKEIIEFIDPESGYSKKYHRFIKSQPVRRLVFFMSSGSEQSSSTKKAVHVVCADDPAAAMDVALEVGIGPDQFTDCERGREIVARQQQISETVGVSGAPTLVVGETIINGFNKNRVMKLLESIE